MGKEERPSEKGGRATSNGCKLNQTGPVVVDAGKFAGNPRYTRTAGEQRTCANIHRKTRCPSRTTAPGVAGCIQARLYRCALCHCRPDCGYRYCSSRVSAIRSIGRYLLTIHVYSAL